MRTPRVLLVLATAVALVAVTAAQERPSGMKLCISVDADQREMINLAPMVINQVTERLNDLKHHLQTVPMEPRHTSGGEARDLGCDSILRLQLTRERMVVTAPRHAQMPGVDPTEDPLQQDLIIVDYSLVDLDGEKTGVTGSARSDVGGADMAVRAMVPKFDELTESTAYSAASSAVHEYRKKNKL